MDPNPNPVPPTFGAPPGAGPGTPPSLGPSTDDERSTAALVHALTLLSFVIPGSGLLVPLIIYLTRKDAPGSFVTLHAKESLNFQITAYLALAISASASVLLIGIPFLCATMLAQLILPILAAIKAKDGGWYTYPLTLRLVK